MSPIVLGELLPDIGVHDGRGGDVRLSSFRGRPLLAVCVRYYG